MRKMGRLECCLQLRSGKSLANLRKPRIAGLCQCALRGEDRLVCRMSTRQRSAPDMQIAVAVNLSLGLNDTVLQGILQQERFDCRPRSTMPWLARRCEHRSSVQVEHYGSRLCSLHSLQKRTSNGRSIGPEAAHREQHQSQRTCRFARAILHICIIRQRSREMLSPKLEVSVHRYGRTVNQPRLTRCTGTRSPPRSPPAWATSCSPPQVSPCDSPPCR